MKMHTPKRTEYKDVVYDSKSEAVFARALEMAGNKFRYHPLEHCGHAWDFLVFPSTHNISSNWTVKIGNTTFFDTRNMYCPKQPILIEYKPSEPTMTYVRELTNAMSQAPFNSVVIWGNPWSGPVNDGPWNAGDVYQVFPIFTNESKWGWGEYNPMAAFGEDRPFSEINVLDLLGLQNSHAFEAARFRFDLQWRPK